MDFPSLHALSPVDGRYRRITEPLTAFFSEASLIQYRLKTEIEYFIALCELPLPQLEGFDHALFPILRDFYLNFNESFALQVKELEKKTNHDIKALEVFLRVKFEEMGIEKFKEFIHFGLTSQDINNTAFPMATRDALSQVILHALNELTDKLQSLAFSWKDVPMLAHTHGQPASPTFVGKEIYVFVERLNQQISGLEAMQMSGKFGGATGNFNAHYAAFPETDWPAFANQFLAEKLQLSRQQTTTQIEHYDQLAACFDNLRRINSVLLDLSKDCWTYISMDYFSQKVVASEVGSSAMPHKVNPIDFENAEGNLGVANALLGHLSAKLPVSRLQRDLSDSTVIRNTGVALAHSLIAYKSLLKGLNKIMLNYDKLKADLTNNWAVVAEAIQTILRREGYPEPYQALKELTRGRNHISRDDIRAFILGLNIKDEVKDEMLAITPHNYTGRFFMPE